VGASQIRPLDYCDALALSPWPHSPVTGLNWAFHTILLTSAASLRFSLPPLTSSCCSANSRCTSSHQAASCAGHQLSSCRAWNSPPRLSFSASKLSALPCLGSRLGFPEPPFE